MLAASVPAFLVLATSCATAATTPGDGAAALSQPAPNGPLPPGGAVRFVDDVARQLGVETERARPPVAVQRRATTYAEDLVCDVAKSISRR